MSEIHGAVGSYVINALDVNELDEFEAHLAVCPTCTMEVVEFCETAAQLSLLAASSAPPPALRSSILSAIQDVRPLPPEAPTPVVADPVPPRRVLSETAAPAKHVDELALRRERRRGKILSLAVAAVTVVALSLGGWAFSLVQARQSQVAEASLETQLLTASDLKVYTTKTANGGDVSFRVSKNLNKAMFVGNGLPALDAQHRYQLWTLQGEIATPDGLVDGGTQRTWLDGPVDASSGLAVTIEPRQGSEIPTRPVQAAVIL